LQGERALKQPLAPVIAPVCRSSGGIALQAPVMWTLQAVDGLNCGSESTSSTSRPAWPAQPAATQTASPCQQGHTVVDGDVVDVRLGTAKGRAYERQLDWRREPMPEVDAPEGR